MHFKQQRPPETIIKDDESVNLKREITFDEEKDDEIEVRDQMNREEPGCQPNQDEPGCQRNQDVIPA